MAKTRNASPAKTMPVPSAVTSLSIFVSYAHRDEKLRDELDKHLGPLKRSGQIETWYDRKLHPGANVNTEIDRHLETSDIVLLLLSPDFFASDYCYCREMRGAIDRHLSGLARIIPVILRPVDWHSTPLSALLALPKDGKPVTTWHRRDEALLDVARGVRRAVEDSLAALSKNLRMGPALGNHSRLANDGHLKTGHRTN